MKISDLSYVEVATSEVAGSKGININSAFNLKQDVFTKVTNQFSNNFKANVNITGNSASVTGSSDANGGVAQATSIIFGTQVEPGVSQSFVSSGAAISYH
ncbi:MAG: hypothetical protein HC857_01540 [Synechococcales cyanobacterium RU_4_20]|nr:hypothetical protein [Synechococcales cyanobacterium RU_4_20]NJR68629.1 hypothetical protein [Synechococcales cyanobacterium CRU_2_2]